MNMEKQPNLEIARKPHAYIEFGEPGHETEYVFTLQPSMYSEAQELPFEWEIELEDKLGEGWAVMNRGHRIEITPPNSERTDQTNSILLEAIKSIVSDENCQFIEKG